MTITLQTAGRVSVLCDYVQRAKRADSRARANGLNGLSERRSAVISLIVPIYGFRGAVDGQSTTSVPVLLIAYY
jgi:hypothetical protein